LNQSQSVEPAAIRRAVIVAATANWPETGRMIHSDRRISVANFKVNSSNTLITRPVRKVPEKKTADALTVPGREHREQEKLGFISDGPGQ
jgi:hypothetical protein